MSENAIRLPECLYLLCFRVNDTQLTVLGLSVGLSVGFSVGLSVGFSVGLSVGFSVGLRVGA
jgi:hypothetical protein